VVRGGAQRERAVFAQAGHGGGAQVGAVRHGRTRAPPPSGPSGAPRTPGRHGLRAPGAAPNMA
jgi:hypothetical protein